MEAKATDSGHRGRCAGSLSEPGVLPEPPPAPGPSLRMDSFSQIPQHTLTEHLRCAGPDWALTGPRGGPALGADGLVGGS